MKFKTFLNLATLLFAFMVFETSQAKASPPPDDNGLVVCPLVLDNPGIFSPAPMPFKPVAILTEVFVIEPLPTAPSSPDKVSYCNSRRLQEPTYRHYGRDKI